MNKFKADVASEKVNKVVEDVQEATLATDKTLKLLEKNKRIISQMKQQSNIIQDDSKVVMDVINEFVIGCRRLVCAL